MFVVVGVGRDVGVSEGAAVGVSEGLLEGDAVGVSEAFADGVAVGDKDGNADADGSWESLQKIVGDPVLPFDPFLPP